MRLNLKDTFRKKKKKRVDNKWTNLEMEIVFIDLTKKNNNKLNSQTIAKEGQYNLFLN